MPWEKLTIGLLGILVALGGWTLSSVVNTRERVILVEANLKASIDATNKETANLDSATADLKKTTADLNMAVVVLKKKLNMHD
jgi:hypothetical protein